MNASIGHNSQNRQTVYRRHGNRAHTAILNSFLQDSRISHETKGLVAEMLSYPEDWDFTVQYLTKNGKSGRDKIYRMLKEAEKFGYIVPFKYRALDGKIQKQTYLVSDDPEALIHAVAEEIMELEKSGLTRQSKPPSAPKFVPEDNFAYPPPTEGIAFVYVLKRRDEVKIGVSKNLKPRISALNSAEKEKEKGIAEPQFFHADTDAAAGAIERIAHFRLNKYHVVGEWFRCSVGEAIQAVKNAASGQHTESQEVAEEATKPLVSSQHPEKAELAPVPEIPDTALPDTGSPTQTKNIYNKTDSSLRSESASDDDQLSPEDLVWGNGLRWIAKAGRLSERKVRPIIGKWLKTLTHDELLHAMRSAKSAKTGDPVAYIGAIVSQATQVIGDVHRENGRIVVSGDFKAELSEILNGRDLQRTLDQIAGKIPIGLSGIELQTKVRSLAIEMMERIADQDRRYLQAATTSRNNRPPSGSVPIKLDDSDRPKTKPRPREEVET